MLGCITECFWMEKILKTEGTALCKGNQLWDCKIWSSVSHSVGWNWRGKLTGEVGRADESRLLRVIHAMLWVCILSPKQWGWWCGAMQHYEERGSSFRKLTLKATWLIDQRLETNSESILVQGRNSKD